MAKMTDARYKQINDAVDFLEEENVPSPIAARMLQEALGVTYQETLELIERSKGE
jgi:hypothetical protein